MKAEGWYEDPYRVHDDRWYSDGTPTELVRDGGVEAKDPPPPQDAPAGPLVPCAVDEASAGPDDLRRADDAEAGEAPAEPDDLRRADEAEADGGEPPAYGERVFETFSEFNPPG
jgi:hypothetical protein